MTSHEQDLLYLLASLTQSVGKPFYDSDHCIVSYWIECGIPRKYQTTPVYKSTSINPTNNLKPVMVREWKTDEEKLSFLQEFGDQMVDPIFQAYSQQYKASHPESYQPERTALEISLLHRLANGELDGPLNNTFEKFGGSCGWCEIVHGIPIQYTQGPSKRFFNGDENEVIPGKAKIYCKYQTDDEKLTFFAKFGRDMQDSEAQEYSWNKWQERYGQR